MMTQWILGVKGTIVLHSYYWGDYDTVHTECECHHSDCMVTSEVMKQWILRLLDTTVHKSYTIVITEFMLTQWILNLKGTTEFLVTTRVMMTVDTEVTGHHSNTSYTIVITGVLLAQ